MVRKGPNLLSIEARENRRWRRYLQGARPRRSGPIMYISSVIEGMLEIFTRHIEAFLGKLDFSSLISETFKAPSRSIKGRAVR